MVKSFVDQILGGLNLFILRHLHGGSWNHVRLRQHGIMESPAECVLHDQLLQLKIGLGNGDSLLVRGHGALRAYCLNRRETADFDLFLGVGECLLGKSQRLFFHPQILVGIHQIPIHVFDLVYRGGDLQAESDVGQLTIVLGDANEASVPRKAKALKEMLSQAEIEVGVELRAQRREWSVPQCRTRIVEADVEIRTPVKALLVGKIAGRRVLCGCRAEGAGRQNMEPVTLKRPRDYWVETGEERAEKT